ncbi:MAG TPA: dicarboxylate/amino acid:cation symporter [bacterium]|nr:dicarboxylate/amino acid:cation symporter [bacterium]
MKLWQKILIGMVSGIIVGLILGPNAKYIKPIGTIFINLIKMLIVPLIFSSLVVGVTSIKDPKKMGRVGLKTFSLYLLTTAIAITIGLTMGNIVKPGQDIPMEASNTVETQEVPTVTERIVNLVPKNPVKAMAEADVLQIIVFAILIGLALNLAGKKGRPLLKVIESLAEVMYKLTSMVMEMAPFGVFALIAWIAGKYGLSVLLPLMKMLVGLYVACIFHMVFTIGGGILLLGKLNPIRFFRGIVDAQAVAYTTSSSSGTLPVTMKCAQENLGVSNSISSFVLPLGATINMDGTALYQGVAALFVAQAYGVDLTFGNYVTIILTSTLASIGSAGVPGAGLIMLTIVLRSVGLPIDGIAIVAGIDRIMDMMRTLTNVTGDSMVALLVAKSENEFDEEIFNNPKKI